MNHTDIKQLLGSSSTTFATIDYESVVKTAAKFKQHHVTKRVTANVTVFAKINDQRVYARAVAKRSGISVDDFVANQTYYEHDSDCFSIVTHKTNHKKYLYCFYNSVLSSQYLIDGNPVSRSTVAEMLTPSARKQLEQTTTHNKTNDVEHNLIVRTIALNNITKIRAKHQEIT